MDMIVKKPTRFTTVKKLPFIAGYEWISESALRHLIFKATPRTSSKGEAIPTNGLVECGAIIRVGRKVLIDLDKFDEWVERGRQSDDIGRPSEHVMEIN